MKASLSKTGKRCLIAFIERRKTLDTCREIKLVSQLSNQSSQCAHVKCVILRLTYSKFILSFNLRSRGQRHHQDAQYVYIALQQSSAID
jgi:hypothetical protein